MRDRPGRWRAPARRLAVLGVLAAVTVAPGLTGAAPVPSAGEAARLAPAVAAALERPASLGVDPSGLDIEVLRLAYEGREGMPVWVGRGPEGEQRLRAVAEVLAAAGDEGLDPRLYHTEAVRRRLGSTDVGARVELELLLSDGVLRYAAHQRRGVRPPAAGDPEASFSREPLDARAVLLSVAEAEDPAAALRALAPAHEGYVRLREALRRYREIEQAGGWPLVPPGPKLEPGMSDPAVPALRRRLAVTGEYEGAVSSSATYDAALVEAVRRFQARHGLATDGVVGEATRAALNVPVARRIEQILVNMERWRWLEPTLGDRHVKVNVPAFSLELVEQGRPVMQMPVVVGKETQRTPSFSSRINQLVFNPPWYVPSSIARNEILPKARADATYLSRHGYVVRRAAPAPAAPPDGAEGPPAPPASPRILGLKQPPGPKNPLGRVKFDLPNGFGVYLHDTPSRASIQHGGRAASHGCVRLSNALGLADALLADSGGLSDARRKRLLSSWETRTVRLPQPVPIHIVYETAWVDEQGALHTRRDIYGRDDTLRRSLARAGAGRSSAYARPQPAPAAPAEQSASVATP